MIQGDAPMPATSLTEIDDVLDLIGKFINEFERVCQDRGIENIRGDREPIEEYSRRVLERELLKIHAPIPYGNIIFSDDGITIIELIKRANSSRNPG